MKQEVFCGNNIELLRNYPDNHFDAIVTDPPYGLGKEPDAAELMKDWIEKGYHEVKGSGFMGKEWDAFVPQPIFWKEVFRVLKHGGHVLAFYGTRTYDWGVMAMRFAGFEVRDCIQWLYGSGFPKSHNISKAIDKKSKQNEECIITKKNLSIYLKEKRLKLNLTTNEVAKNFPSKSGGLTGNYRNWELGSSLPTWEDWLVLKKILELNDDFDNLIEDRPSNYIETKGKIIGKNTYTNSKNHFTPTENHKERIVLDIIAPATEEAKQWDGWGSALKPANEPIVLARKPLEKGLSIAENVLKYGTGGINIDGCRVIIDSNDPNHRETKPSKSADTSMFNIGGINYGQNDKGRFPANLILTHHPECECRGLKKVKAISGGKNEIIVNSKFGQVSNIPQKPFDYSDENGEEAVESWDCHPDCPIKILDEQSGISKSSGGSGDKSMGGMGKNGKYGNYALDVKAANLGGLGDSGGASRFFYVAKASKSERNKGLEGFEEKPLAFSNQAKAELKRGNDNFDGGDAKGHGNSIRHLKNFHPTVKPIKLMQYLVRMITPPNGIVLDPFCGSGTTGVACKLEGVNFVGMEMDAEYHKIAEARIKNYIEEKEPKPTNVEIVDNELKQGELF